MEFVTILNDFSLWRGDAAFVRGILPAARRVVDALLVLRNVEGLIPAPPGWNFLDWADGWPSGRPDGPDRDVGATFHWKLVESLRQLSALEAWIGEPELAVRWQRLAKELARSCETAFWREEAGLCSELAQGDLFTEHAQAQAILADCGDAPRRLRLARRRTLHSGGAGRRHALRLSRLVGPSAFSFFRDDPWNPSGIVRIWCDSHRASTRPAARRQRAHPSSTGDDRGRDPLFRRNPCHHPGSPRRAFCARAGQSRDAGHWQRNR